MPEYDLVLVHAPSVYDFRDRSMLYGPVSDLIPSTPVFEMYPIGFTTIASLLSSKGYRVRIMNLAARMLSDRSFDAERAIRGLRSRVFGIDLHWLPHAHGALEVARLIKSAHPDSKVVLGGFSATYYWEEILREHPQVDAVFLGDSTELPMLEYMRAADSGAPFDGVPNLAYREDGRLRSSGITHVVYDLDEVEQDYGWVMKSVIRSMDLTGHLPYLDWKRNPMLLVTTVRGCTHGCVTCMGSCGSFQRNFGRRRPAFRSPERVLEDIRQIESYFRGAIFLLGDIQQPGKGYAERLLSLLKEERPDNEMAFEFFAPPSGELVESIGRTVERFDAQISPDSHDPAVRASQGRRYDNESLCRALSALLRAGARRVDLFFMIGLPGQDQDSVMRTVEFAGRLAAENDAGERLLPFASPLAPFVDPGSDVFLDPGGHGYTLFARTLEEHRKLLERPSWKHVLNYETRWMTRDQIVQSTYRAGLGLNDVKERVGAVDPETAERVRLRIGLAVDAIARIDDALASSDPESRLAELRDELRPLNESTVCDKRELDWSSRSFYWSLPRALVSLLLGR